MRTFLREHGWKEADDTRSAWSWYDPKFQGARYRLKDAYETVRALVRGKRG